MKLRFISFVLLLCTVLTFCACSAPVSVDSLDERALVSARNTYLNSSLVVTGMCMGTHINSHGLQCSDLKIESVIAGNAAVGSVIHCPESNMTTGESYLLYLEQGSDVYHTEDVVSYTLLSGEPLKIHNDAVDFSGTLVPLDTILSDISALNDTIQVPANIFFYKNLDSLVEASDEIFIGTPVNIPEMSEFYFRAKENGTSIENSLPASLVTIKAYGSIKGALNYGDEITLVYSPAMAADMIDAATLTSMTVRESDVRKLDGDEVYIFFLVRGADAKQDYYFPINPIQGQVRTSEEYVIVPLVNEALTRYATMSTLIKDIKDLL